MEKQYFSRFAGHAGVICVPHICTCISRGQRDWNNGKEDGRFEPLPDTLLGERRILSSLAFDRRTAAPNPLLPPPERVTRRRLPCGAVDGVAAKTAPLPPSRVFPRFLVVLFFYMYVFSESVLRFLPLAKYSPLLSDRNRNGTGKHDRSTNRYKLLFFLLV